MIELKPAGRGRLSIGNGDVVPFQTDACFTIPDGHIGYLMPAETKLEQKYYEPTAKIAPGHHILEAGKYEDLSVMLNNTSATGLRYTSESVIARLVVIPCLNISLDTGKATQSESASSSSSTSKKSSDSTGTTGAKKKPQSSSKGKKR